MDGCTRDPVRSCDLAQALPMLAISEEYARFGTPVYHWPESKPEEIAKVIVYRVSEQDVENAKKHGPAQYPPQSSRRTSSLFCSIVSSGSTNTVCPLELAPWTTPCTLRFCSALTGITNRSPRIVINSSWADPPSDSRLK